MRRNLDSLSLFSHASRLLEDCLSFRELTIRPLSSRLLVLCRNPTLLLQGAQVRVFSLPNMFRNIESSSLDNSSKRLALDLTNEVRNKSIYGDYLPPGGRAQNAINCKNPAMQKTNFRHLVQW